MFSFLKLSVLGLFLAAPALVSAQTDNTNANIDSSVSDLSVKVHDFVPALLTLQSQENLSDATVRPQFNGLIAAFNQSATELSAVPTSAGSNTTMPTNDDLSLTFGDDLRMTATTVSGITPDEVPDIQTMFDELDTAMAAAVNSFKQAAPLSFNLTNIFMLDSRQFLRDTGMNDTFFALGYKDF